MPVVAIAFGGLHAASSAGATACARTVAADDTEAVLQAAFSDAALPDAEDCTLWRVDISGSHDLTAALTFVADIDLEVRGPAGGTAVLRAVPATAGQSVQHRILTAEMAESVLLERLLLIGGDVVEPASTTPGDNSGGAVLTDVLRLVDVELRGNRARIGGAVDVFSLEAIRVSFIDNEAEFGDGLGGAVFAAGDVMLENVTFSGNVAKEGGAIWMLGPVAGLTSSLAATFVTFVGNGATVSGSGTHLHLESQPTSASVRGTVFGAVASGSQPACGPTGSFAEVDWTGTFASDTSCGVPSARVLSAPPTFGTVPFRVGMVDLLAPVAGGPLVDVVECGAGWPIIDQRGVSRPQGTDGRCDAGAVELEPALSSGTEGDTEGEEEGEEEPPSGAGLDGTSTTDRRPVPLRIPAGDGGCAAGC